MTSDATELQALRAELARLHAMLEGTDALLAELDRHAREIVVGMVRHDWPLAKTRIADFAGVDRGTVDSRLPLLLDLELVREVCTKRRLRYGLTPTGRVVARTLTRKSPALHPQITHAAAR